MNHIIEFDTNLKKIIVDDKTNDKCGLYAFSDDYWTRNGIVHYEGNVYICSTREICLKRLKSDIKKDIIRLEKNIEKHKKTLLKIEKE